MRRTTISLLLPLSLTGCFMVGPDYQQPTTISPKTWRFAPAETVSANDRQWWKQFGDPQLTQLIEQALLYNKDLQIATATVEEYLGLYRVTRADLFPQIAGDASGQRQKLSSAEFGASDTPEFNSIQASLNLSWEIDVWGKLRRATEAARAGLFAQEEVRHTVVLTLVTSVARSYVQLRELDLRLEIAKRALVDRNEALRIVKARFENELNSEAQVRQAESEVYNAAALVPSLEKLVAQKEHELSVLLGHNPDAIKRGLALGDLHPPAIPAGLPSELLTRRPDIRQAEQNLIAANANIGVARGQYFPKFTITGELGSSSADFSRLLSGPAGLWSYGVGLAMPLFNAGKIAGQVKAAEAREQQALFTYQNTLLQAFRETEDALVDNSKTQEQVQALSSQVVALREYLKLAWLRYDNGLTSYLEVLDAQRNLLNVEIALASSRSGALQARINIYKAFGGGWAVNS
ncbi:efflux transporter outer membrane subunit [Candidatus Methylobacter oryzae]|uniref:Efflux transporter outer membrane subunit n=1 Tax=Candidatus Methylobacter oryzae TaxID=2497749 RepID=A0ABY3C661_9GAMM|nr:efflux transporter outer membrane subunit [Candidatus Methylobacter oryzae]TRW90758.1 efflux transporter outer membrane subunit [Candidatus Methylobacter oryzae]